MILGSSQLAFLGRLNTKVVVGMLTIGCCIVATACVSAQDGKLNQAMKITPKQDVTYEQPTADVLKECVFATSKDPSGFIVHHSSGRILRRFVDSNGDNKLDQWSYYNNGLEVYRDIDSNFDGRTDEYRWLGPGGTRWGLDQNQDGIIDQWKVISAEEVVLECFESIRAADANRFERLLLTPAELGALQLGSRIKQDVEKRLKQARAGFSGMAKSQKVIDSKATFLDAGNGRPQMMAAGTFDNQRDLIVYDQASGFFDATRGSQLAVGSLVKVGDVWRMVDQPEIVDPAKPLTSGGAFFPLPTYGGATTGASLADENLSKLYEQLTKLDEELNSATGAKLAKLEEQKAELLVQFYLNTKDPKTIQDWLENLADSVAHSYQSDRFENGIKFLRKFVADQKTSKGMDYVIWTCIFAEYGWANVNGDKRQREKAYERMVSQLEDFQKTYPKSEKTADALVQLAVHHEVNSADEPEKALQWYKQCVERFPNTKFGKRADGAVVRLSSFGKTISFSGVKLDGSKFDLRSLRRKIVVLHFWETWCCDEDDIKELAKLAEKYKDDLVIVGCNIEGSRPNDNPGDETKRFKEFVKQHSDISWIQLHAPGSVESSPLAHQLGIATEPMFCLIDKANKLVECNIGLSNLEREIERERRR